MSAQNTNNASSSNWIAYIPGLEEVTFKLRTCPIPGFSASPVQLPGVGPVFLTDTGDRIDFEELGLEFFVDSDWKNYRKMMRWVTDSVNQGKAQRKDITVQLLDNQKNPQGLAVMFYDAFAYGMTQVDTDSNDEIPELTVMAQIKYSSFEFVDDVCEECK